jgi:hypothetical protein
VLGGSHPPAENWRRFSARNRDENRIEGENRPGSHLASNLRIGSVLTFSEGSRSHGKK